MDENRDNVRSSEKLQFLADDVLIYDLETAPGLLLASGQFHGLNRDV